jgi:hypothetical protein
MPKQCSECDFWSEENDPQICPECGADMTFTMFGPKNDMEREAEAERKSPPWKKISDRCFEVMEQPFNWRMAQIGVGIVFYCGASRWGGRLLGLMMLGAIGDDTDPARVEQALWFGAMGVQILAAVLGGIIASAWVVNWLPQGLGVAAAVFALPIILLFFMQHESRSVLIMMTSVSVMCTIAGAYLGHHIIRPMRYPVY